MKWINKIIEKLYLSQCGNIVYYDRLTECYNYNWLECVGFEEYKSKEFYITMIDLNDFKKMNDEYGHLYGNTILQFVAQRLKEISFKDGSIVIRFGGDEFIIFSEKELDLPLDAKLHDLISYGSYKKNKYDTIEKAISRADKEMYKNKTNFKKSKG